MNTNNLKRFAQDARRKLLEQIGAKMELVLTTDSAELREKAGHLQKLKDEIKASSKEKVIDKVAYTWFNRLMALRFMDANDYQPLGLRVVTPKDGYTLPEILDEAKQGHIPDDLPVNKQRIFDILDGRIPSDNAQNEAYKELLIGACNHLNKVFPFLFERINDYAELLLPIDLISEFSIVNDIREGMPQEDCQEVEIIGWLYQFYISEKKDEVFASKKAVKKEDIPAATQLFTPRWIVEYMVQNTVGKLWLQNRPNSKLREFMPYFIESASVKSEDYLKVNSVEEITLLDQACGSGHILVYGFELLAKIYEEEGYNPTEIPQLIIEKNLFGFEIDERAAQLAGIALMMKARSYQRRFFAKEVKPKILCYQDLILSDADIQAAFKSVDAELTLELKYDLNILRQATNLGSLIVPHTSNAVLQKTIDSFKARESKVDIFLSHAVTQILSALEHLKLLSLKYHCIVDNPPYMGGGNMNKELSDFVKKNYPDSKADLMTCFMETGWGMLYPNGILGMINLPSWLFLSSFEKIREKLIQNKHIDSLLHMGRGIFGIDWGSTAFIIRNRKNNNDGSYFKLHKRNFQHIYPDDIKQIFVKAKNDSSIKINFEKYREGDGVAEIDDLVDENGLQISYMANQKDFEKIPGSPIGYWLSEKIVNCFEKSKKLGDFSDVKQGLTTSNNERFIRFWHEVAKNTTGLNIEDSQKAIVSKKKWFLHNKGGTFRKWYGNLDYVVNYFQDGLEMKNFQSTLNQGWTARIKSREFYFKKAVSWSMINSGQFAARFYDTGTISNIAGPSLFNDKYLEYILGFLNSRISNVLMNTLNPTLNNNVAEVNLLPFIVSNEELITTIVKLNISISKLDWDSKETSLNYVLIELLNTKGQEVEESYELYKQYWKNKYFQLHKNEEELNKKFIEIYGLQDELTPDVALEDISILKEETSIENGQLVFHADEVFAQFISYAVGCMFGRYSLDKEGLILANQGETLEDYLKKVEKDKGSVSFLPDEDNVLPVLDDEWFEDDIVGRFREFLKVTFGKENLEKNLAFVEECIGKDIRKYFVKDFYNDHVKRYKKRPIYWMFSSPKGSFNVLIYMHRYTPDTLNLILTRYLKTFREKLNNRLEHLEHLIETGSQTVQSKSAKEKEKIKQTLNELLEYERDILYPLASERISIDLDDGVLVNYNKFGKAIKEVAGLNDKATKKKVMEFDWIDTSQIR